MIEPSKEIQDRFDYLDDRPFDTLNEVVYQAALNAHAAHRPVLELSSSQPISAHSLGQSFYFFLFSVYLSSPRGEPFTQDGVEGYKKNMYHQLGKEPVAKLKDIAKETGLSISTVSGFSQMTPIDHSATRRSPKSRSRVD